MVGAALGRYGGAWAHAEARKSLGIAGAEVVESIKLSVPIASLDGAHPREGRIGLRTARDHRSLRKLREPTPCRWLLVDVSVVTRCD